MPHRESKNMAKSTKKTGETPTVTRAEKRETAKNFIRELLKKSTYKSNDLIDEASKLFVAHFTDEEKEDINGVKGRIGSLIDVMKKEEEIVFDGGVYALKVETPVPVQEEKKAKKSTRAKAKKAEDIQSADENKPEPKKRASKKAKTEETVSEDTSKEEKAEPLPPSPLQPIAPVAPITPEVAPEPVPPEKPAPKKRAVKKAKTEEKAEEPVKIDEPINEEPVKKEEVALVEKPKAELAPKGTLMDMSFLFGEIKQPKKEEPKKAETPVKSEEKPAPVEKAQATQKPVQKPVQKPAVENKKPAPKKATGGNVQRTKTLTADERLQDAFLSRLHKLGGEYFEYYSVYLLEKYSRMNGRRLESLRITGGDHDGGIDGEIELTDKLGFRETIYIQAKNWDPSKGDEKLWVVGETLLQQFIGACVCRQAKEGKQHCRGMFITTSRFTPDAKKLLEDTSDKFVGYDGNDLYETAKECSFGLIKKNGEWVLDDELLSGLKAFYSMR